MFISELDIKLLKVRWVVEVSIKVIMLCHCIVALYSWNVVSIFFFFAIVHFIRRIMCHLVSHKKDFWAIKLLYVITYNYLWRSFSDILPSDCSIKKEMKWNCCCKIKNVKWGIATTNTQLTAQLKSFQSDTMIGCFSREISILAFRREM